MDTNEKREVKATDITSDIIEKAISKTLEAIMPLLQAGLPQQSQAPVQQILSSNDVRMQVSKATNTAFDREMEENRKFLAMLATAPASDFVMFSIPRIYEQHFGSVLPVSVNGSMITIPIDNRPHRIHKLFVAPARAKIDYEDEKAAFMHKHSNNDTTLVDRNSLGQ